MRALRVSLRLSPVVTAMFANSPFYEGGGFGGKSYRAKVWLDVDPTRQGLVFGYGRLHVEDAAPLLARIAAVIGSTRRNAPPEPAISCSSQVPVHGSRTTQSMAHQLTNSVRPHSIFVGRRALSSKICETYLKARVRISRIL